MFFCLQSERGSPRLHQPFPEPFSVVTPAAGSMVGHRSSLGERPWQLSPPGLPRGCTEVMSVAGLGFSAEIGLHGQKPTGQSQKTSQMCIGYYNHLKQVSKQTKTKSQNLSKTNRFSPAGWMSFWETWFSKVHSCAQALLACQASVCLAGGDTSSLVALLQIPKSPILHWSQGLRDKCRSPSSHILAKSWSCDIQGCIFLATAVTESAVKAVGGINYSEN